MSFLKEFKEFAMKGNVMDMAIGVVIGTAFGKIITSLVNDVIMPPIGVFLGGMDFSDLKLTLKPATLDAPATTLNYGAFINTVVNFLIMAAAIFTVIHLMKKLRFNREYTKKGEAQ